MEANRQSQERSRDGQCGSVGKGSGGREVQPALSPSALGKSLNLHQLSLLLCEMETVTVLTSQGRGEHYTRSWRWS